MGKEGSRQQLCTPCLVLDLDALERNLSHMAKLCRDAKIALRPHAKTHKSIEIARRQIDAGAVGICVATIGEAEVFANGGIAKILITSPLPPGPKMVRLIALIASGADVSCVVDDQHCAACLDDLAKQADCNVPVYIDIDTGRHRTGVASPGDAALLARRVITSDKLQLGGLQAYAGHLSHLNDFEDRKKGARETGNLVASATAALIDENIPIPVVTGGSTGTVTIDPQLGALNELQCGSYVFMDVEYDPVDLDGRLSCLFEPALFVRTTVISKSQPDMATTDAGWKHFATKIGTPPRIWPDNGSLNIKPQSDEHGTLSVIAGEDRLQIGDSFECWIPHCDPTANLFSHYHVVRGDTLVDIWPVDARGAI